VLEPPPATVRRVLPRAAPRSKRARRRSIDAALLLRNSTMTGGLIMLMFNRSQLYLGLALAGLFEIIVKVVVR
jgi:hypothetical protein